jgi:hypothetical protein
MRRILALSVFLLGACAGIQKDTEDFMDDLRSFQEGIRWRKYEMTVDYLPTSARERFLSSHDEMDNDLRIDDYEVQVVHLEDEHRAATVTVKYTWHLDSVGNVHDTTVEEKWKKLGKNWHIIDYAYKRGDETMPELVDLHEPQHDGVDKG